MRKKSDFAQNAKEIIKTNQRIIIQITYTSSDHDKNIVQFKKKMFKIVGGFGTQGIYLLYALILSEPEK